MSNLNPRLELLLVELSLGWVLTISQYQRLRGCLVIIIHYDFCLLMNMSLIIQLPDRKPEVRADERHTMG